MSVRSDIAARLAPYRRVVVWGAGGLGRNAVASWLPRQKIVRIVDGNPEKVGTLVDGIPIRSIDTISTGDFDCLVICTNAHSEVRATLTNAHVTVPVHYIYELFLPEAGWATMSPLQKLSVDIAATKNAPWPILLLQKPQILVNFSFRWLEWSQSMRLLYPIVPLLYVFHYWMCVVFSIQLPHKTRIGPGLIFAHFGTIVFTSRANIGAFFTIYHGCTVGTDSSGAGPLIEDFVTQFAGSHVLGKCKLGRNVRVGANAVVLGLEAPEGSSVVGVPARVLSWKA